MRLKPVADNGAWVVDHGGMTSRGHWRDRLLGTLQGQLQLATYVTVFFGFTGASCAGLWVSERNLFRQHSMAVEQSAAGIALALERLPDPPSRLRVQQQLESISDKRTIFWFQQADGSLIFPRPPLQPPSPYLLERAQARPSQQVITNAQRRFLTKEVLRLPSGASVWAACDVSVSSLAFSSYISWMILIWSLCLVLTLLVVTVLVRRIVRPLLTLTELTATVTAETLQNSHVQFSAAPQEISRLADNYEDLLQRLSLSWSHQRQFVSAVSHELRTPLTIVGGYIKRTLRTGDNLEASQRKGLQTAEQETLRMRHLLDDLLDLSRGDSGRLSVSQQPVALLPLLEQVQELAQSAQQRSIALQLPDRADLIANADPDRLQQVLLNLIENACKYSAPEAPVELALLASAAELSIEVRDQGIGVPPEDQERIFERFQRASNAPAGEGSGLGLSVVRLLVEGMGGQVSLRSQLGKGSVFSLHLRPVEPAEEG